MSANFPEWSRRLVDYVQDFTDLGARSYGRALTLANDCQYQDMSKGRMLSLQVGASRILLTIDLNWTKSLREKRSHSFNYLAVARWRQRLQIWHPPYSYVS